MNQNSLTFKQLPKWNLSLATVRRLHSEGGPLKAKYTFAEMIVTSLSKTALGNYTVSTHFKIEFALPHGESGPAFLDRIPYATPLDGARNSRKRAEYLESQTLWFSKAGPWKHGYPIGGRRTETRSDINDLVRCVSSSAAVGRQDCKSSADRTHRGNRSFLLVR